MQYVNGNANQNNTTDLDHNPYSTLTTGDIKFGYFESSVVPSSNRAKAHINGGRQPGSLARKSEYFSPTTFRSLLGGDFLCGRQRLTVISSKSPIPISC